VRGFLGRTSSRKRAVHPFQLLQGFLKLCVVLDHVPVILSSAGLKGNAQQSFRRLGNLCSVPVPIAPPVPIASPASQSGSVRIAR
jgi:hypothetical protein